MTRFDRERWRGRWHVAGRAALAMAIAVVVTGGVFAWAWRVSVELRALVGP